MRCKSLSSLLAVFVFSSLAVAEIPVTINGAITVSGTGCSSADVDTVVAPDNASLSILFTNYQILSPATRRPRVVNKTCDIKVPLTVAPGYRAIIETADYRGFAQLSRRALASFYSLFSIKDARGTWYGRCFYKLFAGPMSDEFFLNPTNRTRMRACGGTAQLTMRHTLGLYNYDRNEDASIQLDSTDFTTNPAISTHVRVESCR